MIKYGFNFLWMFSKGEGDRPPQPVNVKELDFLAETGFNFVRVPTDYRFWTNGFNYQDVNESVFELIDSYLQACKDRNLHMCLNMHRVPGYCINGNDLERDNLWLDDVALDGFVYQWELFAKRYKGVPNKFISFDLINEPPSVGQYGFTRENHERVIRRTVAAIRAIDPDREIVIDGIGGGNIAVPELADLGVIHSGRGYQPFNISHYKAGWVGNIEFPEPLYPGKGLGDQFWDKEALRENYRPWLDVQAKGVEVHIGEFGCYSKTPNDVALRWFTDLLSLYKEFQWGYSLWNFKGDFGIVEHGRPGATYENYKGFQVDRQLLELLLENRVN
jgi:endoglucanase